MTPLGKSHTANATVESDATTRMRVITSELPEDWRFADLRSICQKTSVWNPAREKRERFRYIDVSSVSNDRFCITDAEEIAGATAPSRARKIVKAGDVIYATVRPSLKRIAWIEPRYNDQIASTAFCVVRADPKQAVSQYLYFFLLSDELNRKIIEHERGASYPAVTDKDVLNQFVPLPSPPEQAKIAAVLWKMQKAVEIEDAIVRNTRDLKKSLLRRLFTHGLRGEPLKETEIGKAPESWTETTLGEVCTDNGGRIQTGPFGSQLHASDYQRDGLPVVNPTHLSDNKINHADIPRISRETAAQLSRHVLQEGDILFGRRGEIGRHGLVGSDESGWLCGTGCFLVRIKSHAVHNKFISFWFSTEPIIQWLNAHAAGAIMPNLNNIVLGRIPLVLPDINEQREIADILQTVDRKIDIHESKKRSLQHLFKTLLHKLMTAQIRVNNLDIDTSEVEV